jgi:aryl-alcohol dehydrogenase-like predicted oxidoreductase
VLARGGLAKGLLAGKPAVPYLEYTREQVAQAAEGIRRLADGHHSVAQTALSFVLADPAVTSAVTGIRTMEQLEAVVGTSEGETRDIKMRDIREADISEPDIKEIADMRKIIPINFYDQHR